MILAAACLGVLYLLLAGHVSFHELLAGLAAWGLGLSFAALARRAAERRFAFGLSPLAVAKVAGSLAVDSWRVGAVLWQVIWPRPAAAIGTLRRQPFRYGGSGPRDAARRAWVTAAKSLAPNEFVVDIPENGSWLCVHALANRPTADDPA